MLHARSWAMKLLTRNNSHSMLLKKSYELIFVTLTVLKKIYVVQKSYELIFVTITVLKILYLIQARELIFKRYNLNIGKKSSIYAVHGVCLYQLRYKCH